MNLRHSLESWTITEPFEIVDARTARHLDLSPAGMIDFKRTQTAPADSIYVLSQSDMGKVGEVRLTALGVDKTEILFQSYWGPQITNPLRNDKRKHLRNIADFLRNRLADDGLFVPEEEVVSDPKLNRLEQGIVHAVAFNRQGRLPTKDSAISDQLALVGIFNRDGENYSREHINRVRNDLKRKGFDV